MMITLMTMTGFMNKNNSNNNNNKTCTEENIREMVKVTRTTLFMLEWLSRCPAASQQQN